MARFVFPSRRTLLTGVGIVLAGIGGILLLFSNPIGWILLALAVPSTIVFGMDRYQQRKVARYALVDLIHANLLSADIDDRHALGYARQMRLVLDYYPWKFSGITQLAQMRVELDKVKEPLSMDQKQIIVAIWQAIAPALQGRPSTPDDMASWQREVMKLHQQLREKYKGQTRHLPQLLKDERLIEGLIAELEALSKPESKPPSRVKETIKTLAKRITSSRVRAILASYEKADEYEKEIGKRLGELIQQLLEKSHDLDHAHEVNYTHVAAEESEIPVSDRPSEFDSQRSSLSHRYALENSKRGREEEDEEDEKSIRHKISDPPLASPSLPPKKPPLPPPPSLEAAKEGLQQIKKDLALVREEGLSKAQKEFVLKGTSGQHWLPARLNAIHGVSLEVLKEQLEKSEKHLSEVFSLDLSSRLDRLNLMQDVPIESRGVHFPVEKLTSHQVAIICLEVMQRLSAWEITERAFIARVGICKSSYGTKFSLRSLPWQTHLKELDAFAGHIYQCLQLLGHSEPQERQKMLQELLVEINRAAQRIAENVKEGRGIKRLPKEYEECLQQINEECTAGKRHFISRDDTHESSFKLLFFKPSSILSWQSNLEILEHQSENIRKSLELERLDGSGQDERRERLQGRLDEINMAAKQVAEDIRKDQGLLPEECERYLQRINANCTAGKPRLEASVSSALSRGSR